MTDFVTLYYVITQPISAERIGKGRTARVDVFAQDDRELGSGMMGWVRRILLDRGRGESIPLALKELDFPFPSEIEQQLQVHKRLRQSPTTRDYVLPTFRAIKEGFLMTDLTENGKKYVFSGQLGAYLNDTTHSFKDPHVEFLQKADLSSLKSELIKMADACTDLHVELAFDAFFLVVDEMGKFRVYIADLDNVHLDPRMSTTDLRTNNQTKALIVDSLVTKYLSYINGTI